MENRMKVAYLFGGMNRGGAETIMLDVFRNWQNAPFPFIGIHRKGGAYKEEFYASGPSLYQLAPKRFGYLRYFIQLRKLLKEQDISVVHTQHWLDCIYAWLATKGMHIRIVNTFHGFYSMKGANGMLCRLSIRLADDVCFVSKCEQEWYQRHCRIADAKCHVTYNGVDFTKFDSIKPSEDLTFNIGHLTLKNEEKVRLCMVGSFSPARDHLQICKALHQLHAPIDFYFIGAKNEHISDSYRRCYEYCGANGLLDRIHFVGEQSNVYEWLKEMDGFVYATKHDTFGIALIEALAMGLPAVVSDWEVMGEICAPYNGKSVQIYHMLDENDCAQKIDILTKNLVKYKEVAVDIAKHVRNTYSMKAYFLRLLKIYSQYDNFRKNS